MPAKSPVIVDLRFHPEQVREGLKHAFPGREVINRADPQHADRDLSGIDYAVLWKPLDDLFTRATDLKVLFSGGAGVDHVLTLPGLPNLPLVRFVDHTLTTRMSEWIVMQCLMHLRQHLAYDRQQHKKIWNALNQPEAAELTVGMMGMGVLGSDAARKLKVMGFNVLGWSRSGRPVEGIEMYSESGLDEFLSKTDILVGLLPLTADTANIFDAKLFAKLRKHGPLGGPVFINAGRGGSQVEADLAEALKTGVLKGASLDVFQIEPLPDTSPFWTLSNVILTPHSAADSDVSALFAYVEKQIDRFERGEPMENLVARDAGY
ncbi:glyoxylate/hydroxypyruvate reductase A [Rhizobium sp. KVB221]|uniref:Glyoxylate/hydroxypyruvate reductase A n=1 Tax=Rhizobium setariae TaxID=2801340 RepID=A0A936YPW1_9HYPH|nr:glyoxylate/hydroxypyruvate reductase A [Rhizobium setariae]MBL0370407.1 glyoxylate/hydroxypyruvate reductase A [Rhizobium setariae]